MEFDIKYNKIELERQTTVYNNRPKTGVVTRSEYSKWIERKLHNNWYWIDKVMSLNVGFFSYVELKGFRNWIKKSLKTSFHLKVDNIIGLLLWFIWYQRLKDVDLDQENVACCDTYGPLVYNAL